ncbi:MAG TPA: serine/threonine-protein kinase, partial [Burkholderiales bacterium]|nr:serine/threonine-protein kinase [Burkholderiales bacterium]
MSDTTIYRNALPLKSMLLEYRLEAVLGAGGFGMTYLGWDTHLEKHVAIKEYLPVELAVRALDGSVVPVTTEHEYNYRWGLERFILEARTLAKFSHPHIVRVMRYFEANATGYMVMDYERGESLNLRLGRGPAPDEAQLEAILLPLLDGLQAVHEAGFLHRDIKPSNIFIRESGGPVLLDFGAARQAIGGATKSLTSVLTPGYAPLEQYSSDGRQGPWSDIYALAGVLYRALTGENPPDAVSRMKNDPVP